ncbi:MAG TPA: M4 family metallopeptidase [Pyrinomonadaceae bacterium]|jgi:thermolysin
MKKTVSVTAVFLIAALFFNLLPISIRAQKTSDVPPSSPDFERIQKLSLEFLDGELDRYTPEPKNTQFKVLSVQTDELGLYHTKLQQFYNDIPVWGSEAIVHLNRDESLYTITNDLVVELEEMRLDTVPQLPVEAAVKRAFELEGCAECRLRAETRPELWLVAEDRELQKENPDDYAETKVNLAYRIQLEQSGDGNERSELKMPVYFIDARTGEEVLSYDNLQTQSVTNSGSSLYSGTVNFTAFRFGAPYYLENLNRRIGTFNGSTATRFSDADGFWISSVQRAGVDAHWGTEQTLSYYQNVFGRNGLNGSGGPISVPAVNGSTNLLPSIVHFGTNYNNAFWNGNSMTYGDGDGVTFSPLVSVDVVGHEMTHGVTQFSAGLVYSGQSGALNESMSDVFGNMIERYAKGASANNWLVGEQVYTPGTAGDALRNMGNTHAQGQPDHWTETPFASGGSCGVHTCSGVPNNAFYLLSQGGTHHIGGSMTGIGADRAAAIWYYALTNFMTSGTTFAGARTATINAANALYGATEANATARAWCLVGVGVCTGVTYRAHVANLGWLPWVSNGAVAGTTGQSRRMEAAQIFLTNPLPGVGITYRAHVAGFGWLPWVSNGTVAGTTGQSRQMEAIQIFLSNAPASCTVTYRAHVAGPGWLPWVSNGAVAGTTGQGRRMEALQVNVQCP